MVDFQVKILGWRFVVLFERICGGDQDACRIATVSIMTFQRELNSIWNFFSFPESMAVSIIASVERILFSIIHANMVRHSITARSFIMKMSLTWNYELCIFDSISNSTHSTTKVWIIFMRIFLSCVKAKNYILYVTFVVWAHNRCYCSSKGT